MPTFKLDEQEIEFQPGETIIQAAHRAGVDIPHYCWHPGLSVAANCRMCLVEVGPPPGRPAMMLDVLRYDAKKGDYVKSKKPKLQPACQQPAVEGLEVKSQTSEHVKEARAAVQEFLLLNHPVDCPICDQAGECRLQDYWLEHSGKKKRMRDEILHKPKAVDFGPTIVYDAERCIVCTRCVRFCEEVVKDPVLDKRERGNVGEIVLAPGRQLDHDYTLMTEHVCPVGALTAKDFRFKARVWFLRTVPSICQGCATGCNSFTDYDPRKQTVYRHRPRENQEVNQYWMCDAGMLDYQRIHAEDRILDARVAGSRTTREDALLAAQKALSAAQPEKSALLLSALHSNEDNFALLELAQKLGIQQVYLAGKPSGAGDDILRHTDKNPNRAGVLALLDRAGLGAPSSAAELAEAIGAGRVQTVLSLGSHIEDPALGARLAQAQLIALATHEGTLSQAGQVVLPASSWAEAEGTFVNFKGMSQVSYRAITPQGSSLPAWRWALLLAESLGKSLSFKKAKELRAAATVAPVSTSASDGAATVGAQA